MVSRTCTLSMSGSKWPLSQRIDYLLYAGKSMKEGGYEDREVVAGGGSCCCCREKGSVNLTPR